MSSPFWSPVVSTLTPYVPGEQPKISNLNKLNTNVIPYGPSPRSLSAMREELDNRLRLYPDPNGSKLKEAIAQREGLTAEHVFLGNGSDEVLAHVFMALLKHPEPLYFPDITYSFYPVYCGLYGIDYRSIALNEDFQICVEDYFPTSQARAGGIIFPNPNAPTGCALTRKDIEIIVKANPQAVVVIDEAYVDFGAESAVNLITRYPNVLVVQTFSKSRALAGLRVGFALGHPTLIEALERVKNSFNSYPLGRLAQVGAQAALQDDAWFKEGCAKIIASRQTLIEQMQTLGFEVLPSKANFIFARHPKHEASALTQGLRESGIIVRHFKAPRIDQFLRITIGTPEQCDALVARLKTLLSA